VIAFIARLFGDLADAITRDWRKMEIASRVARRPWGTRDDVVNAMIDLAGSGHGIHPEWFADERILGHWTM
jgi:hypothetical protein